MRFNLPLDTFWNLEKFTAGPQISAAPLGIHTEISASL